MEAKLVLVNVIVWWDVKLHCDFIVLEEQSFYLLHLDPVGAPI